VSQYFLFEGDNYHAFGGARDYAGVHDTLEEAKAAARLSEHKNPDQWAHIAKLCGGELVIVSWGQVGRTRIDWEDEPQPLSVVSSLRDRIRRRRQKGSRLPKPSYDAEYIEAIRALD
jgi:hypothetical protein